MTCWIIASNAPIVALYYYGDRQIGWWSYVVLPTPMEEQEHTS